jgi:hypothetical protein
MDIKQRELKMQEKRKNTSWRDFVKEIISRMPIVFYKTKGVVSKFPYTERVSTVISFKEYEASTPEIKNHKTFFLSMQEMFRTANLPATTQYN